MHFDVCILVLSLLQARRAGAIELQSSHRFASHWTKNPDWASMHPDSSKMWPRDAWKC